MAPRCRVGGRGGPCQPYGIIRCLLGLIKAFMSNNQPFFGQGAGYGVKFGSDRRRLGCRHVFEGLLWRRARVSYRNLLAAFGLLCVITCSNLFGQSPSVLYTWDNSGNPVPSVESWIRNFGGAGTSATLSNATPGTLTLSETSAGTGVGLGQAFTDGFNRVRESSTGASGGTDLT